MENEDRIYTDWLFKQNIEFEIGAQTIEQIPPTDLPEVAFAGRSNVGKSSLINALTARKALARTSQTPGRTQQINFFNLAERIYLVDLPGYGYAKASKYKIKNWNDTIKLYLKGRPYLRRVYLLIDARRGILDVDNESMKLMDEVGQSYQIVFTKIDKVEKNDIDKLVNHVQGLGPKHPALHPEVIFTSSLKKMHLENLRYEIALISKR